VTSARADHQHPQRCRTRRHQCTAIAWPGGVASATTAQSSARANTPSGHVHHMVIESGQRARQRRTPVRKRVGGGDVRRNDPEHGDRQHQDDADDDPAPTAMRRSVRAGQDHRPGGADRVEHDVVVVEIGSRHVRIDDEMLVRLIEDAGQRRTEERRIRPEPGREQERRKQPELRQVDQLDVAHQQRTLCRDRGQTKREHSGKYSRRGECRQSMTQQNDGAGQRNGADAHQHQALIWTAPDACKKCVAQVGDVLVEEGVAGHQGGR
jgi:hypothetical protein